MPFNATRGVGAAKGYGLLGSSGPPLPVTVITSRNGGVSEGVSSNFASASTGLVSSWGYSGNNTDAIVITTSGSTAKISGITINNQISSSDTFTGILYLIAGNTTGGAILGSSNFSVVLSTGIGSTMIRFTTPVTIAPGVYTCALAWPNSLPGRSTYQYNNTSGRTSSSVTANGKTLNVSYASVGSFNGAGPLGSSNGTSISNGQCVSFEFLL